MKSTYAEASWITGNGRSLYAWIHRPADLHSKGTVVLAPSLGREQVVSYRTLRVLAMMLAEQGWVAIRFAFSGTGESEDQPVEPHDGGPSWIVENWLEDLGTVVDFAQRIGGHGTVHSIGLRLGAALLAESDAPQLGMRLLWEPVGGKMFLRQHSTLRRLGLPDGPDPMPELMELGGLTLSARQGAAVGQVPDPAKAVAELPAGSMVVRESDPKVAKKMYAAVSLWATTPTESLQGLIDRLPQEPRAELPRFTPKRTATLQVPGFAAPVVEEIVLVGPDEVPAVYTSPVGEIRGPAAQFAAASAEPKDGATSLWVQAARRLAARGIPAMRFERTGCGDLGDRSDVKDPNPYTSEAIRDSVNTAWWLLERTGRPATGIGLCAGAWLMAVTSDQAPLDRVVMINNVAWREQLGFYEQVYANMVPEAGVGALRDMESVLSTPGLKSRIKEALRDRGPYALWLALGKAGKVNAPEVLLEIGSRSAELLVYFGSEDAEMFIAEHGQAGLKRLRRAGRTIEVHQDLALDHALLAQRSRLNALAIIEDAMLERSASTALAVQ